MKLTIFSLLLFSSVNLQALEVNKTAPEFALLSLTDSKQIRSADYKGLLVYVDFWASWCLPCAKTFPELENIYQEFQPYGFEIIAVSIDDNKKDALGFLKKHPASFLIAHDPTGSVAAQFALPGMPVGYLLDSHGRVKKIVLGLQKKQDAKDLAEFIRKELDLI